MRISDASLVLGLLAMIGGGVAAGADFDAGMAAYTRKDYPAAFREWSPLADAGDARSQYYLGLLYGKLHDTDHQGFYLCLGAEQGYKEAQVAYAKLLEQMALSRFSSAGVLAPTKLASAYKWCVILNPKGEKTASACTLLAKQLLKQNPTGLSLASLAEQAAAGWEPTKTDLRMKSSCATESAVSRAGLDEARRLLNQQRAELAAKSNSSKSGSPPSEAGGRSTDPQYAAVSPDGSYSSAASVRGEVEKIRDGPHSPIPPAQRFPSTSPNALSGRITMTVRNSTQYTLSVYFDGPTSRSLSLSPGASQTLDLPSGVFHVAGRVAASNVLPFYGDDTYEGSADYTLNFYIR